MYTLLNHCVLRLWGKAVASRILLHRRLPLLRSQKYSKIFPFSNKSFGKTMTTDFVRKPCGFLFLINIFRDSGKYYVGTVSSVVDNHVNTAAEEPAMGCSTCLSRILSSSPDVSSPSPCLLPLFPPFGLTLYLSLCFCFKSVTVKYSVLDHQFLWP